LSFWGGNSAPEKVHQSAPLFSLWRGGRHAHNNLGEAACFPVARTGAAASAGVIAHLLGPRVCLGASRRPLSRGRARASSRRQAALICLGAAQPAAVLGSDDLPMAVRARERARASSRRSRRGSAYGGDGHPAGERGRASSRRPKLVSRALPGARPPCRRMGSRHGRSAGATQWMRPKLRSISIGGSTGADPLERVAHSERHEF
jgi:hypothetical protein